MNFKRILHYILYIVAPDTFTSAEGVTYKVRNKSRASQQTLYMPCSASAVMGTYMLKKPEKRVPTSPA